MPEPQQTQEQNDQETCPKNPFGHSWRRVVLGEGQRQQRCRFCQQTRESRLPPGSQGEHGRT